MISRAGASPRRNTMRLGVSLSTFAAAAETTNVVDRAVELGSQAERLGLDSVWFAQMASYDALAVASAVGRAVPRVSVATGAEQAIPVVVAAMGLQALRITGEFADGTLPFLAGPKALEQHIVPVLTKAAAGAGRPAPRIIVTVPAVVTDKVEQVIASATDQMA